MTRGIPGDGYITHGVYRVPLPKTPGERRARYAERTVPAHLLSGRRSELAAWKRDFQASVLEKAAVVDAPSTHPETTGQYLAGWLAELPVDLAPNSVADRRRVVRRHLVPHLGAVPLADLTPRRIEAMLRALPLAPASVAHVRAILVIALNDAVRLELLTRNPAALARGPRRVPTTRARLDAGQVRRLVAAAAGERLGALILVGAALGLRRGELLGLRWADIDLAAGTLQVAVQRQNETGRGSVERPPKAGSGRTIPLPAVVAEALAGHRDRQRFERQPPRYADHGLVFARLDGLPLSPNIARRLLLRTLARANEGRPAAEQLPALTLHSLRRSAASVLLGLGVPLTVAMSILGHRTSAMTLEVYAAALPGDVRAAAAALDAVLGG